MSDLELEECETGRCGREPGFHTHHLSPDSLTSGPPDYWCKVCDRGAEGCEHQPDPDI